MSLSKTLNRLMHEYSFYPSKKKAQNFITSQDVLDKMIHASELTSDDIVLEVGAGTGFLTQELLKYSKVVAVEFDQKLCEILEQRFAKEIEEKKLVLVCENFLYAKLPNFNKVVCLPPYTISSDMLFKLLLEANVDLMCFVFQREFVRRAVSEPGFHDYGVLSVLLNHFFDSRVLVQNISPENFFPKPNSFSSLVVFTKKKNVKQIPQLKNFVLFLKTLFRFKNKNVSNALQKSFPFFSKELKLSKKVFEKKLESLEGNEDKVYQLSSKELFDLYQLFLK